MEWATTDTLLKKMILKQGFGRSRMRLLKDMTVLFENRLPVIKMIGENMCLHFIEMLESEQHATHA